MPIEAVALSLVAALVHAGWNAAAKRSAEPGTTLLGMAVFGFLLTVPWLVAALPALPAEIYALALLSGLLESLYVVTLGAAYKRYDFSLVYPVARGSAPVWIAILAALALGERPAPLALIGIGCIVTGIYLVALRSPRDLLTPLRERSAWHSLLVGLLIASYSVVDKRGVQGTSPAAYLALVWLCTVLWLVPLRLTRQPLPAIVLPVLTDWRRCLAVGAASTLGYGLVLWAFTLAPASYVGALRESSVVFAALIGWLRFGERLGGLRTFAALLVTSGAALVARS